MFIRDSFSSLVPHLSRRNPVEIQAITTLTLVSAVDEIEPETVQQNMQTAYNNLSCLSYTIITGTTKVVVCHIRVAVRSAAGHGPVGI